MNPTPVAVNKAKVDWDECSNRTVRVGMLTIFNLGRYFNPKPLFLGIMEVDEPGKEENNRCSPKDCER